MDLVQGRIVTDDVERLAAFYACLARASVALNDHYVEVPTRAASVGFSRRRFTEYRRTRQPGGAVRSTKPRSCSTSGPATWTPNTSGSVGWDSHG